MPLSNQTRDGEQFDLDTILAKVKKVQALTSSSNPGEAASAAATLQRLLFRYNLDLQQLNDWKEKDTSAFRRTDLSIDGGWDTNLSWRRTLMGVVTQFNFCSAVTLVGTNKVAVIGRPQNIQLCAYLFDYLSNEIARLADVAYLQTSIQGSTKAWRNSFYVGAVNEVYRTLKRQREHDEQEAGGTALARITDRQLEEAKAQFFTRLSTRKGPKVANAQGYYQGVEAGKNIRISDALQDSQHRSDTTPKQLT